MEEKVLEAAEEAGFAASPAGSDDDEDYELLFGHKRGAETPVAPLAPSKRSRIEVEKRPISDTDPSSRESRASGDDDACEERDSVRARYSPRVWYKRGFGIVFPSYVSC